MECHERALRDPVAHVCVARAVAAELLAGWGIRATVVPNGVDAARCARAASSGRAAAARRCEWRCRLGGGPLVLTVDGVVFLQETAAA